MWIAILLVTTTTCYCDICCCVLQSFVCGDHNEQLIEIVFSDPRSNTPSFHNTHFTPSINADPFPFFSPPRNAIFFYSVVFLKYDWTVICFLETVPVAFDFDFRFNEVDELLLLPSAFWVKARKTFFIAVEMAASEIWRELSHLKPW